MAGYIRQSTFSDGDTITAALFNNEYDQLLNVFSNTSGHKHDGTAAEGPVIGLIGDAGLVTPLNKILIDTTNDHIEFWLDVSGTSTQQLYIADGAILPVTDNDIDLGSSSLEFKDLYLDGTANIDSLVADTADINGGTLDNVTIGGTTAAAGTFTTVDTSGNVIIGGNLTVSGTTTTVNSNEVNIGDNIIVLNSDETGTPSQNGGIEVERGTSTNVSLLWNETNDYWTFGSNHLNFPDNSKAYFGTGNDLEIYHDGSNSYIDDNGTGELRLRSNEVELRDMSNEVLARFSSGGASTLFYDNSAKLATSQDGIDVTGHISVTGQSQAFKGVSISGTNPSVYFRDTEASNAWHVGQNGGILYFLQDTDANGAYNTISAFIDASNNFNVPNGDVGIGISTAPALQSGGSGLHIHDTNNSEIKFTNSTTGTTASDGVALVTSGSTFTINNREAGNITFGTSNTERVRIDSAGNIGIGTASPSVPLHVAGGSSGTNQSLFRTSSGGGGGFQIVCSDLSVANPTWQLNTFFGEQLAFGDGTTEKMRLDSSGNLGIGTSSPSELLHVEGNALVTGNLTVNGNLTFGNAATDTVSFGADIDSHIIPDDDDTYDLGSASQQWRDLYLDGVAYLDQVGIGTNSPSSYWSQANDLVIAGSSNRGLTIQSGASANGRLVFTDQTSSNPGFTDGGQIHYDHTNDAMNLRTSGTDAITINSSQNVGIGTNSPSAKLDVAASSGSTIQVRNTGTAASLLLAIDSSQNSIYSRGVNSSTGRGLRFIQGSSEAMRIDTSGNVLVGTTAASVSGDGARLMADGQARFATASDAPLLLNRNTNDGDIAVFRKDNTNVGAISISNSGTDLAIDNTRYSDRAGLLFRNGALFPRQNAANADNAIDLGGSGARFKNLYLGGDATIDGNLTVSGTTTTIDTTNLNVEDKNITINYSTGDSSSTADGAGITIQDAVDASTDASLTWNATNDVFEFSHGLDFGDNEKIRLGASQDLQVYHTGFDSYIDNFTGHLVIRNQANNKDIVIQR
jgi:hypothetical protein